MIKSMITSFPYKKQSKLVDKDSGRCFVHYFLSETKDGLVSSGSKEGKSLLLLDSWLHEATA